MEMKNEKEIEEKEMKMKKETELREEENGLEEGNIEMNKEEKFGEEKNELLHEKIEMKNEKELGNEGNGLHRSSSHAKSRQTVSCFPPWPIMHLSPEFITIIVLDMVSSLLLGARGNQTPNNRVTESSSPW
ncbi:hypothetical protein PoB_000824400 [Plakobranchus ocellatus]|uniref:Uncharacterized protein n=1 Tax=Plakobranchus ocellatus TaxID=259542 RepID=A0AAV3YHH5_9GAST|nr:hypothetical protein PoB_000824400 [Plakobranchus ocellatus]